MAVQGLDENATLPTEPQLADSLTEALKSLKEGSGLLQEPIPPEGLSGMFSGLNLDDVGFENHSLIYKQLIFMSLFPGFWRQSILTGNARYDAVFAECRSAIAKPKRNA